MWNSTFNGSNDLTWYDASTGKTYIYNLGDIAWVLCSTALVMIMIPGVGFFYSGLLRRKNALSMIYFSMISVAVASLQWFFWGYSLAYSHSASRFIGDLKHFALIGVFDQPSTASPRIPANVFCLYQLMFAAFTPTLALGGFAEHCRLGPVAVFVFVWSTLVYDPIACWTWNERGWIKHMKDLDWAGGTPVHISSGTAALAISFYLRPRYGYGTARLAYKPHNSTYVVLGTVLLWFGWFGFNGGSALSANLRAAQACMITHLAACAGGITWMLWDYRLEKRWSVVGFCSGALSGLVTITPAAGYVGAPAAVAFGVVGGSICNFSTHLKFLVHYDDCLDVFASHGIGGIVGNLLTGIFAQASAAASDGSPRILGGWLDRNYTQLAYQLASSTASLAYSFAMTTLILWIFHIIPGLRLRTTPSAELLGMDRAGMGEHAYDYVERDPEPGYNIMIDPPMQEVAPAEEHELRPAPRPIRHAPRPVARPASRPSQESPTEPDDVDSQRATIGSRRGNNAVRSGRSANS
ncbi:hypothetical protein FRC08_018336 [Ceratobasidium sp. 394]|nr:hypothetical protein FRC08_018336 [Ceratobasidium sp. 394]